MTKNIETNVENILIKDGVRNNDFDNENELIINVDKLISFKKNLSNWSKRLINTESNSATIISQQPGESNRKHYHPNWDEWWFILEGEWEFEIEGQIHHLKKHDLILIKKNKIHKITAIGNKRAIRLAVSRGDVEHIFV